MANEYQSISSGTKELKKGPTKRLLQQILDYSRSVEVKGIKSELSLVHMN